MGFSCGIVGLPNVGKSTIFSAITSAKAAAENFPFCTIEPNTGAVPVPDERIETLAKMAQSAKIIPTQMTLVDIAGLIRGASQGEGLGNQFLGHIRSVDAILHVVRAFEDENVIHVDGAPNPIRDIETIETELLLADLEAVQKQIEKTRKIAKSQNQEAKSYLSRLESLEAHLSNGTPARSFEYAEDEMELRETLSQLITRKPTLYVANIDEEQLQEVISGTPPALLEELFSYARERGAEVIPICGKLESEISELPREERGEYLESVGLERSGFHHLLQAGYRLLGLLTYFTVGPKETRAWTITKGTAAPQAAGKIHSDFERGFIRAEVIAYADYVEFQGEAGARDKGKLRTEGKEYIVADGDVVHFRFNV
ncbi:redox-regulated ATPase YchF [bacterium]|nr:redox-regulated ATPase YchF [bacterium]